MKATAFHSVIHLKEEDLPPHEPACPLCFFGFERTQGFSKQSDPDVFLLACPRCRGFSASRLPTEEALRAYYGRHHYQALFRDSDKITFQEPQCFARHLLRKAMPFLQNEKLKILDFGGAGRSLSLAIARHLLNVILLDYYTAPDHTDLQDVSLEYTKPSSLPTRRTAICFSNRKNPLTLAHVMKTPWRILGKGYQFVGGWEVIVRRQAKQELV